MANSIKQLLALKSRGLRIATLREPWQVVENGELRQGYIVDIEEQVSLIDDSGNEVAFDGDPSEAIITEFRSKHELKLMVLYDVDDKGTASDEDDTGKPISITHPCYAPKGCRPDWNGVSCAYKIGPGIVNDPAFD